MSYPGLTEEETTEFQYLEVEAGFFGLPHMEETKRERMFELHQKVVAEFNASEEE